MLWQKKHPAEGAIAIMPPLIYIACYMADYIQTQNLNFKLQCTSKLQIEVTRRKAASANLLLIIGAQILCLDGLLSLQFGEPQAPGGKRHHACGADGKHWEIAV
jgi:hypothetical protein